MTTQEQMQRLCDSPTTHRDYFQAPFVVGDYIAACDGSMVLAVIGSKNPVRAGDAPPPENVIKYTAEWLAADPPRSAIVTTAEKLCSWSGDPCWESKCWHCKGAGKRVCVCPTCDDDHSRDCSECRGEGSVETGNMIDCDGCDGTGVNMALQSVKHHGGLIADAVVDIRRVARLMSCVDGECHVWSNDKMVHFKSADWHAILMATRDCDRVVEPFAP